MGKSFYAQQLKVNVDGNVRQNTLIKSTKEKISYVPSSSTAEAFSSKAKLCLLAWIKQDLPAFYGQMRSFGLFSDALPTAYITEQYDCERRIEKDMEVDETYFK